LNLPLFQSHPRTFESNRYVYPVLSRRAGGISIGVNLNPDKLCNFDCIYCQVDRSGASEALRKEPIDIGRLTAELEVVLDRVASGQIYAESQFGAAPQPLHRLNDIAFSGDGEPTLCPNLAEVVAACAEIRRHRRLDDVKLVLITNASLLHRPRVAQALAILDANNGEIWAKLDAGTEDYYRRVARSGVSWQHNLQNVRQAALVRPIVIQSLFMRISSQLPPPEEIEAYCDRLDEIVAAGGRIKLVQVHTVARSPAESWVSPLANAEVDALAERVRLRTGLPTAAFYGY
jgi:wyosine [tRNA(Phe)-imidazoG37] synthetase (radical SAM superfamily)